MLTRTDLNEIAKLKLSCARTCLRRYAEVSGGDQDSDLYRRLVRDVRFAARECLALETSPKKDASERS